MTLVLTELSTLGIAMAADSAVTSINLQTGLSHAVPNAANKLQVIPYLDAGISCWGLGSISGQLTDEWLRQFIDSNATFDTLGDFATELAAQLNAQVSPNTSRENRLGFHLAGFEECNGEPTPSFYHIHDGPSTALERRGIQVDPSRFNANHDMPSELFQKHARTGFVYITRNGDYQLYARIFGLLEGFFSQLRPMGIVVPNSQNLADRAEYLVFQIRTVSEIYRLSNLIPGIGGGIHFLTICDQGIHSQGVKYF